MPVGNVRRATLAGARRGLGLFARLSLTTQFLLVSLVILLAGMLLIGMWVGHQVESSVLDRTAEVTGLYVNSVTAPYLQSLVGHSELSDEQLATLDALLTETPLGQRIATFKVWSTDGQVLYSTNRALIGQRFPIDDDLGLALSGQVAADVSDLREPENVYERQHWRRLLQVYIPVRQQGEGQTIAVTEFYQLPDQLEHDVAVARLRAWGIVAAVMIIMYLALVGIVKRGSNIIASQDRALRQKIAELSNLLEQNNHLHERVRKAAGRTTALNEQALRRIGADLHDGPGQALALALLRLDTEESDAAAPEPVGRETAAVRGIVQDALTEIRAISSGLRLPELEALSLAEVVERAVRDHERQSGIGVTMELHDVPSVAPLAIKIALFRSLQEALSNAARHGGGVTVTVNLCHEAGRLHLHVSDFGPGFIVSQVAPNGHLGLAGIRERAELLGGNFQIDTAPGQGTALHVDWPLDGTEAL